MFTRRFHLFTLLGFRVGLDLSWFLLAILLVWSLSRGYFPAVAPDLELATYYWMGVLGALGLFASIVFHEFAHAMVARRLGLPIGGITLFIFGGVAELEDEPATPGTEFLVAVAGPIASFVAAGFFYLLLAAGLGAGNVAVGTVVAYLAFINLILAVFNLLPAFPLDGGRILRAALWRFTGDVRKATRVAATFGSLLGAGLMVLGVLNIVAGYFVAGMWQMLIGFFIHSAAGVSRTQTELREGLKGIQVRHIMKPDAVSVPAGISVADLVENYVYRYYFKFFPVVDGRGRAVGAVRLSSVRDIPRDRWATARVEDVMEPIGSLNVLSPGESVLEALKRMKQGGPSRFLVTQDGELRGVLTMRDILDALAVRMELEQPGGPAPAPGREALAGDVR